MLPVLGTILILKIFFGPYYNGVWRRSYNVSAHNSVIQIKMSFSISILSRGGGVPSGARRALQQSKEILSTNSPDGTVIETIESVIGLEGERRLCVTFDNHAAGNKAWQQIKAVTEGVDLVTVELGACKN